MHYITITYLPHRSNCFTLWYNLYHV